MSVEAISWALNLAPVPTDRNGQPSSACKFVLVGLANHVGPDGTGAFPAVATLVRYTGLSERTVRTCLDRLEAVGVITPCDPDIVAARIKRADRRPQGWDLNLTLVRDDRDGLAKAEPERQLPARQPLLADRLRRVRDDRLDGVQQVQPAAITGCNQRTTGVQLARSRGAVCCIRTVRRTIPRTVRCPRGPCQKALGASGALGGGSVAECFAALGEAWSRAAAQRARLASAGEAIGCRPYGYLRSLSPRPPSPEPG